MFAPKTQYEIIYNGKNITGDILPSVKAFTYTDKATGEADEIEIILEDSKQLWQLDWYPNKGDIISAKIIDLGRVLNCGTFTVDEITGSGSKDSGDTFSIKGLAAGIGKKIRTKNSYAHENKSLREIVNTIATKHGLTVEGKIDNITIRRRTQYRQTDLNFLQSIGNEYGYTFSIRDKKLIFTNVFDLENKKEALTLHRKEIISYSITDKTSVMYQNARVRYHNTKQKKVVTHDVTESNEAFKGKKPDTLELHVRAENKQQAELKTKVALYKQNSMQQEGQIEMPGNIYALAGNNIELVGFGFFSGKYYLPESSHQVTDNGYITSLNIKRIGFIEKKKHHKDYDNED